jgi:hypothetical protein
LSSGATILAPRIPRSARGRTEHRRDGIAYARVDGRGVGRVELAVEVQEGEPVDERPDRRESTSGSELGSSGRRAAISRR